MTKLDAGLITSLPASDPGSAAVWGSKRINPRPQFCLCLAWSGCPSNDDDDEWIPGHSSLPGNDLADSLAKAGASLDPSSISVSLTPLISSQRLSLYTSWRRSVQSGFFQHQIPTVSPEELTLPRSARCALSRLRCNGHSTLLNSYLHRVGRAETPSCSNCGSEPQDLSHLVLDCPVLDPLRRAIFGHTPSLLDLWSRPWGVARLLGFRGIDPRPHP